MRVSHGGEKVRRVWEGRGCGYVSQIWMINICPDARAKGWWHAGGPGIMVLVKERKWKRVPVWMSSSGECMRKNVSAKGYQCGCQVVVNA